MVFALMLAGGISGGVEMSSDPFATQPKPWVDSIHQLTLEEYEGTLKYWAAKFPSLLTLEKRGDSLEGMPIYLLKITDSSVPAADKQVVMVSALHGGPERTGATTILHLAEWLLGDSELARETRRKQILLLMPMLNPHAFFVSDRFGNKEGVDLYDPQTKWWDVNALKLSAPDKTPELATFLAELFAGTLISDEGLTEMTTTGPEGYGLGLFATSFGPDLSGYGHNGSIFGYTAMMAIDPATGATIVIVTNNDELISDRLAARILMHW